MKHILFLFFCISSFQLIAQKRITQNTPASKPKLMVGLVIDQMRWDFLYRFQNRYSQKGFNRLLNEGFSCENTFIPYTPTVTAAGHSCVYTGSVPALTGIMGNAWYSKELKRYIYCTEDSTVQTVGADNANGKMSPANMFSTTIGDQLKLSNQFKSKVVGIAIKDRGAILPAGHSADAAFWYDGKSGNWISSTHYMATLPKWVSAINNKKMVDDYFKLNWNTLYPIATYNLSTQDEKPYEGKLKNEKNTSFPHNFEQYIGKDYDMLPNSPYGNSYTLFMAKQAIDNMQLGKSTVTDFLAVSLSTPDYIGHRFGPNSIEIEDQYLRLDKDIEDFLNYLDQKIGKNNYSLFLTADHGVAHVPGFLKEHKLPAGNWDNDSLVKKLNISLQQKFKVNKIVLAETNYQLYLNDNAIITNTLNREEVVDFIIQYCDKEEEIAQTFDLLKLGSIALPEMLKNMLTNGYYKKRSGDIQIILKSGYIDGGKTGTTHGLWNTYDSHIPMLWYGNGIKKGKSNLKRYMTDIAPTIAAMLQIQMPSDCVGDVMTEVFK